MARTPPPPGPPPRNYRPPGAPRPTPELAVIERTVPSTLRPPSSRRNRWAPAAALVVALVGSAVAFAAWRGADEAATDDASASTTTTAATGGTIPPNSPTTDGPPGTELDPDVIGTLEDPIPLGEPYIIGVFEVTVNSADFDAYATLADHDGSNPEPEPGHRRVLVETTIRFMESQGFSDTAYLPFDVRNGSDIWTDLDAACGAVPDSILDGVLLAPDDAATGNLCFTVPDDAVDGLLLTTEGFAGPVYFELS